MALLNNQEFTVNKFTQDGNANNRN